MSREQTSLEKSFNTGGTELINEFGTKAEEIFILPTRNWNNIIDDYNTVNKKKFALSALECRRIIEYAKKSVPPHVILEAVGITKARFQTLSREAEEVEDKLQELNAKDSLTDEEYELFQKLLRHPMRVLVMDVARAVGISKIMDWEAFEKNVAMVPELQLIKMKARFKDFFGEQENNTGNINVRIEVGGNWIENL